MPKRNKKKLNSRRRQASTLDNSFRRNNVVINKAQREVIQRQRTVTERQYEHKAAAQRRYMKLRLVALTVVAVAVFSFLRLQISGVEVITEPGYQLSNQDKHGYSSGIMQAVSAHTFLRQPWLLDKKSLQADLQNKYPEIAGASFRSQAPLRSNLTASIAFRRPVFIWQDASKTDQFVDRDGVLFSVNRDRSVAPAKLVRIEDQSGIVLEPGTSVLTGNLVQFVGQLHSTVPAVFNPSSVTISKVIIPKSTREVWVQVSDRPYLIKLSSKRGLSEQMGELKTLLAYLQSKSITPGNYIDVRLAHKAFYK